MESRQLDHKKKQDTVLVSAAISSKETAGSSTVPDLGSQPASVRIVAEPPASMVPSKSGFKLKIFQGGGLRLAPSSAAPVGDQQFFFRQISGGQPQLFMSFKDSPHKLYHIQAPNGQELNIKLTSPVITTKPVPATAAADGSDSRAEAKFVVTRRVQQPAGKKTIPSAPGKVTYVVTPPGSAVSSVPPGLKVVSVKDKKPAAGPLSSPGPVVRCAGPGGGLETQQAVSLLSGKTVPLDQTNCDHFIIPPKNRHLYKKLVQYLSAKTPAMETDVTGEVVADGYVTDGSNTYAEKSDLVDEEKTLPAETNTAETDNESAENDDDTSTLKIDSVFSLAPDSSQEQASEQSNNYAHGASEDHSISVEDFYHTHCYTQEEMVALCGLSFVVLERLSARAACQGQPSHYGCSHYCRQRTLNFLCMAGLIKCPTKYKPTLFKQEVDDSSSECISIKQEKCVDNETCQTRYTPPDKCLMRFNLPEKVFTEEQDNVSEELKNGSGSDPHLSTITQHCNEPGSVGGSSTKPLPLTVREKSADVLQNSCTQFQKPLDTHYNLKSIYDESFAAATENVKFKATDTSSSKALDDELKLAFLKKKLKSDICDFGKTAAVEKNSSDVTSLMTALNSPIICPPVSETLAGITSTAAAPLSVSPICPPVTVTTAGSMNTAAAPLSVSSICLPVTVTTAGSMNTAAAPLSVSPICLPVTVTTAGSMNTAAAPLSVSSICLPVVVTTAGSMNTAAAPLSVSPICLPVTVTTAGSMNTTAAPLSVSPICLPVTVTTAGSMNTAAAPLSVSISTLPATVSAAIFRRPTPDVIPASACLQVLAKQADATSKTSISESTKSTTVTPPIGNQESAPGLNNLVGIIVNNTQGDGKPMLVLLPLAPQGESAVIGSHPKVTSNVPTAGTAAKPLVLTATPLVPTLTPGLQPNSNLVVIQKSLSSTVAKATAPILAHPLTDKPMAAHCATSKQPDVITKTCSAASLVSSTALTTLPAAQVSSSQNLPKTLVIAPTPSLTKHVTSMVSLLSPASHAQVSPANSVGQFSFLSGSSVRDVAATETTGSEKLVPQLSSTQCVPGASRILIIPTSVPARRQPGKKNSQKTQMVTLILTQVDSQVASGVDNETVMQSTIPACTSVQMVNQALVTATPKTSPLTSTSTPSVVKTKLASLLTSSMSQLTDITDKLPGNSDNTEEICERKKSPSELERKYPLPPGVVIKTEGEAEFGCPTGPDVTWEEIDDLPLTFALPLQTDQEAEEERLRSAGVFPERSTYVYDETDAEIPLDLESSETAIMDDTSDEQENSTELECPCLDGPALGATTSLEEDDSVYSEPPVLQPISPIPAAALEPSGSHHPDLASFHHPRKRKRKHHDVTSDAEGDLPTLQNRGSRTKARKTAGQIAPQSSQERENQSDATISVAATGNSRKRVAAKAKGKHCKPATVDAEPWPMTPPPSLSASSSSLTSSLSVRSYSTTTQSAASTSAKSTATDRIQQLKEMLRQQNEALEQIRLRRAAQPPLCLEDFGGDSR